MPVSEGDIRSMIEGMVPVLRERMEQYLDPHIKRIAELEREVRDLQEETTRP